MVRNIDGKNSNFSINSFHHKLSRLEVKMIPSHKNLDTAVKF